jgi:hypothetical protein
MAEVKINRRLNLVLSIEGEKGRVHVHSVPISRSVFEDNWLVISRTLSATYMNKLGPVMGPRVAALALRDEAKEMGIWEGVQNSLLQEIKRLTNVIVPSERGWETLPYGEAIKRGWLDEDQVAEVENSLVYFTCASWMHPREQFITVMDGMRTLWGAQTTSSNVTEYQRSLPISMPVETTGEKPNSEEKPSFKAA